MHCCLQRYSHTLFLLLRWLGLYQQLWHQPPPELGGQAVCSTDPGSEGSPVSGGCGWNEWHHRNKVRRFAWEALCATGWESHLQGEICAPIKHLHFDFYGILADSSKSDRKFVPLHILCSSHVISRNSVSYSRYGVGWSNNKCRIILAWSQVHVRSGSDVEPYVLASWQKHWHLTSICSSWLTKLRLISNFPHSVSPRVRWAPGATVQWKCVPSWRRWNKKIVISSQGMWSSCSQLKKKEASLSSVENRMWEERDGLTS